MCPKKANYRIYLYIYNKLYEIWELLVTVKPEENQDNLRTIRELQGQKRNNYKAGELLKELAKLHN
jgi:hypothetical protein